MTIYQLLKKDHERAKKLMDEIEALDSKDTKKRDELFNQLKKEILVHAKVEEKVFYSPLSKHKATAEEIEHAKEEHQEVEDMLERLSSENLHGAAWMKLFRSMCESLKHHIREEEGEIFSDAKKEISAAESHRMEETMKQQEQMLKSKKEIPLR